jgi:hypothetical protein
VDRYNREITERRGVWLPYVMLLHMSRNLALIKLLALLPLQLQRAVRFRYASQLTELSGKLQCVSMDPYL